MSSDNSNNNNTNKPPSPQPADMQRNRRGSVTSNAFSQLFQRSSSIAGTPVMPNAVTTAAIHEQRRRLSLSTTTLGITGTSPNSATGLARRASTSTNSDFDENAIEEDDSPTSSRTAPVTPFHHRMSFGAAAMRRPTVNSPGTANGMLSVQSPSTAAAPLEQYGGTNAVPSDPPEAVPSASAPSWKLLSSTTTQNQAQPSNTGTSTTTASAAAAASRTRPRAASDLHSATRSDQGFNWSEQLRSRAESTVASGSRPSFSFGSGLTGSPPRPAAVSPPNTHDRARSVSEMPAPPAQTPKPRSPPRDTRPKPDHFQERILKGDFYMD